MRASDRLCDLHLVLAVGEQAIDLIELLEHNPKMIEASQKDHPINHVLKIAMAKAYGKRPHSKVEEVHSCFALLCFALLSFAFKFIAF
jgi:hypothetical protein